MSDNHFPGTIIVRFVYSLCAFLIGFLGLYPGLTENAVTEVLDNTLRAAGLDPFFDIVLFGESVREEFWRLISTHPI